MPILVFGSSSRKIESINDTSLFVQKSFLKTKYKIIIEDDIDMKNQLRIKNLPDPLIIREAAY